MAARSPGAGQQSAQLVDAMACLATLDGATQQVLLDAADQGLAYLSATEFELLAEQGLVEAHQWSPLGFVVRDLVVDRRRAS